MKKLLLLLAILSLQCSKSQDSDNNTGLSTNKMLALINQQRQKGCNCGNTYYKAVPRLSKAGYKWSTWAENVAMGQQNEEEVMKSWLSSPGHCANIMNPNVTEVGAAHSGDYWTQLFAAPSKP